MATKNKKKKAKKKSSAAKSPAKKKTTKKTAAAKKPVKNAGRAKAGSAKKGSRGHNEEVQSLAYEPRGMGARSGGQSGDLQGLSDTEGAESESVDELLEEGNAFEAEVVKGVEDVGDADEGEVRTHEVPEEDVPEEYFGDEDDGPSRKGKTVP